MNSVLKNKTVADLSQDRANNFDFIRFVAASMVLFSHAFPVSGSNEGELLKDLTNVKWSFGDLGVAIFFVISGFLISKSYDNSKSLIKFTKSRILRIFPALAVVILLSSFILGPFVTTLPLNSYFTNPETYNYLKLIYLFPLKMFLPGVFENNPYPLKVNASLWTLQHEIVCYVLVGISGFVGLLKYKKVNLFIFLTTFFMFLFVPSIWQHALRNSFITFLELFSYFSMGMLIYSYRKYIVLDKYYAMISIVFIFSSLYFGHQKEIFVIFGSYLIIYFAFIKNSKLNKFGKYGDFSYGIYIYAFPIQQTVAYLFQGNMSPYLNILISFPITLLAAVLSWHIIEKRFLKIKNVTFIKNIDFIKNNNVNKHLSVLKERYNVLLQKVISINWPVFCLLLFTIVFVIVKLHEKPQVIEFPYQKSDSIFHGNWVPQSPDEKYRWIAGSASVDMERPTRAQTLMIQGYVPDKCKGMSKMNISINNNLFFSQNVKAGEAISVMSDVTNILPKRFNLKIEFDYIYKPEKNEPDVRELSAYITKILISKD